jgi:hypothetical protein
MPSIRSTSNNSAILDLLDFTGKTLELPNTTVLSGNTTFNNTASFYYPVKISDGLLLSTTYTGTYTDGTVIDYSTGNGRISVGASDGIIFYTGGVGATPVFTVNTSGYANANGLIVSSGGIGFSDGSVQLSAGASPGLAVAMSIVFGG